MTNTWLITGISSGLGRIMAEKLLERGDRVVGTARRVDAVEDLTARYRDTLHVVAMDLVDPTSIRRAVNEAFTKLGRIDAVVSNAGYGLFGAAEEVTDAQIDKLIATNLTGSMHLIRAVIPHLREQRGGRIMQVSSEGGQFAYPSFSVYHASKWGIEGFVEAVAQEVASFGIKCVIAEPGPTGTNFGASLDWAKPLDAYTDTPVGMVRNMVQSGKFEIKGDAARTVDAMIAALDADAPPLRLALGSTAYEHIHGALTTRLAALESQKAVALSADVA